MGLEYYGGEPLKDGQIRISPSSISNMFRNGENWYQESILKNGSFTGNTNTRLGTIVHNRIEHFYNGTSYSKEEELEYLSKEEEPDSWAIMEAVEPMYKQWLIEYGQKNGTPEHIEKFMSFEPMTDIIISGSCDAIHGSTVVDFKTSSTKKSSIGSYWYQLYLYAWLARKENIQVDSIRVVYIIKPTKTIDARVIVCDEPIEEDKMNWLLDRIKLEAECLIECRDNPSLAKKYYRVNPLAYGQ